MAWANMQEKWLKNCDAKMKTGYLLRDLSAAFNSVDPVLMCKKLELYGVGNFIFIYFA